MQIDGLTVRRATIEDAGLIHSGLIMIEEAQHMQGKISSTASDIAKNGFGDNPAFMALIAEMNGEFAGLSLFFRSFSTWRGETGAYVQDFVVTEEFRGRGIAEALLKATAKIARDQLGAQYLRLAVDVENHRARRFYEGMGLGWARSEAIHAAYDEFFTALADD